MKKNISILDVHAFEWYDGLVLGLIQTEQFFALAYLLAFDPDHQRRCFCILPITEIEAQRLHTIFKANGPQGLDEKVLASFLSQASTVLLTRDMLQTRKTIETVEASPSERAKIHPPKFPMIEAVVDSDNIAQWLSKDQ